MSLLRWILTNLSTLILAFALSLVKQAVIYGGSLPGGLLWLRGREKMRDQDPDMVIVS